MSAESASSPSAPAVEASPHRTFLRRVAEIVCAALVMVLAAWEIADIPVKAWMVTHLSLSSIITNDPIAEVGLGARAAVSHERALWLPLIWACASISAIKWHLVAFWAGRLWGDDALSRWSSGNPRREKWEHRLTSASTRWPVVGVVVAHLIAPVGILIMATFGISGLTWRRLIKIDIAVAMILTFGWIYFGFYMGVPAVHLLDQYSRYAGWVAAVIALAIVGWLVYRRLTRASRRIKAEEKQRARQETQRRLAEEKAVKQQRRTERAETLRTQTRRVLRRPGTPPEPAGPEDLDADPDGGAPDDPASDVSGAPDDSDATRLP